MSNYLAFATVTAALGQVIAEAMNEVPQLSNKADVVFGKPTTPPHGFVGANLYLFDIAINPAMRNEDLPMRDATGQLVNRPQIGYDLFYLLTFYGAEQDLEPQRLLGIVVSTLNAYPMLTREQILNLTALSERYSFLNGSDLADDLVKLRISPIHLTLEELSRLWTIFSQEAHALAVAYQVSIVVLQSDVPVKKSLPVMQAGSNTSPQGSARLLQVQPPRAEYTPGMELTVNVANAPEQGILARFEPGTIDVPGVFTQDGSLHVVLPTGMCAGITEVCLVQSTVDSASGAASARPITNALSFTLLPRLHPSVGYAHITDPRTGRDIDAIEIQLASGLRADQPIQLMLNAMTGTPPTGAGFSSTDVLRVRLADSVASELKAGPVSQSLISAFDRVGLTLSSATKISPNRVGNGWTLYDSRGDRYYRIEQPFGELVAYYGLSSNRAGSGIAFAVRYVPQNIWLVRVELDGQSTIQSQLLMGKPLFDVPLPNSSTLDTGVVSATLRRIFQNNGILLSNAGTVSVVYSGWQWMLHDGARTYLLLSVPQRIRIFDPNSADAIFVGPTVHIQ